MRLWTAQACSKVRLMSLTPPDEIKEMENKIQKICENRGTTLTLTEGITSDEMELLLIKGGGR